ncbi:MAG: DNA polymerase III subunit alpha [Candidatus Komeilibacteria bacterium]
MSFVHLHVHSHYSLLDGLGKIDDLIQAAKDMGMPALALTDHGVMYGAVEFYQKAIKAGIKPIIGVEAYIAPHGHEKKRPKVDDKYNHLILLATNNTGYTNLLKLTSIAHLEGYYYKPRIDWQLLEKYHEGIIALSACLTGQVPQLIKNKKFKEARVMAQAYRDLFGAENFFLELQDHPNIKELKLVNAELIKISRELDIPLVATNDVHYIKPTDNTAHDVLICLQTKHKLNDTNRLSYMDNDFSLRSPQQMQASFVDYPEAIKNTLKIAERCNVTLDFDTIHLPHFELPANATADEWLEKLCREGISKRYGDKPSSAVEKRLQYELDIIKKTGYSSYFLIVQDFINWAKNNNIVVGPGRGSAAGSIVSYLTGITNIDPLHYDLIFERFLNPDRISMPDIDTDFSDIGRDQVIRYVADKYGHDRVSQIITFGTMAARVAIRDVGRVMGYSYGYCDRIAKLIPMFRSLQQALDDVPELKDMYKNDPEATQLIDMAKRLEGIARHTSTHACGVLITKNQLTDYVPLQHASSSDDTVVSQYSLHPVEDLGLLKMDFLGLKNLTLIETTVEIIDKTIGEKIDIDKIPLDNKATYRLFRRGDTTGVFQFESAGMKRYLKQLKPNELEDIIAMVALYRPGPMELIPDYIASKHGQRETTYLHPLLKPILSKTHGIIIYQEQIMQLARQLAGFTYGQADVLRKAVGKKIKELLQQQEKKMVDGMIANNIKPAIAKRIWEFILPFARYGFNRSHAACYALIAYQTAYLKANYPAQFMAALLTSDLGNTDKVAQEVAECEKMGIKVLPPDINESFRIFTVVVDDNFPKKPHIRFGLEAIKNVGHNIASAIIHERKANGQFTNLEDFLVRVTDKDLNRKSMESLIKAGAFDQLNDRQILLDNLDKILNFSRRHNHNESQSNLFTDTPLMVHPKLNLEEKNQASKKDKLAWEKEFLGMYISDHPMNAYQHQLNNDFTNCQAIHQGKNRQSIKIAGIITNIKKIITNNGKPMLFAGLEDNSGGVEIIVFNDQLENSLGLWEEGKVIKVQGRISNKDGANKVVCERAAILELRRSDQSITDSPPTNSLLTIGLPKQLKKAAIDNIKQILSNHPGKTSVQISINGSGKVNPTSYKVDVHPELLNKLAKIVGQDHLSLDN